MKTSRTWIAALAAVVCAGLANRALADEPKAETPRACVEGMHAAAARGDFTGMCAYMAEPARTKLAPMFVASIEMNKAQNELVAAIDEKFGPDSARSLGLRAQEPPKVPKIEILEEKQEGEKATVKTRDIKADGTPGKEETMHLVKAGENWRIEIRGDDPKLGEQAQKMSEAMAPALKGAAEETRALIEDVKSGKAATKQEVGSRFTQIRMKMVQAGMAAGAGGRKPRPDEKGGEKPKEGGEKPNEGGEKPKDGGEKKPEEGK